MKMHNSASTRTAYEVTLALQSINSFELMERAAGQAYLWVKAKFPDTATAFCIFCGQGNNGGDGLIIARLLHADGYAVSVRRVESAGTPTPDFKKAWQLARDAGVKIDNNKEHTIKYANGTVIIDALFGIGLSRELNQECAGLIRSINNSNTPVIAIDVPSGMYMDKPTLNAIRADVVLTFQYPKLAFFIPSNYQFIAEFAVLDIGLDSNFLTIEHSDYYFTDMKAAIARYKPVGRYAHKGTQGHALIIGGSYGKIGAVTLSARGALSAGCGLVTAYIPKCGYNALQSAFPEAMVITDGDDFISEISFSLQPRAVAIGMGMGQQQETRHALHAFLQGNRVPLVIDADALNMLAEQDNWLALLPEGSILTPHPKELERLVGSWNDDFDKLERVKAFSRRHRVVVVAKDACTMVFNGDEVHINATGNAALATGGSGDVLAGIITGLLAQGYTSLNAAIIGVFLHGLTADIAVGETGFQAFTASMITGYLGKAFVLIDKELEQN